MTQSFFIMFPFPEPFLSPTDFPDLPKLLGMVLSPTDGSQTDSEISYRPSSQASGVSSQDSLQPEVEPEPEKPKRLGRRPVPYSELTSDSAKKRRLDRLSNEIVAFAAENGMDPLQLLGILGQKLAYVSQRNVANAR